MKKLVFGEQSGAHSIGCLSLVLVSMKTKAVLMKLVNEMSVWPDLRAILRGRMGLLEIDINEPSIIVMEGVTRWIGTFRL